MIVTAAIAKANVIERIMRGGSPLSTHAFGLPGRSTVQMELKTSQPSVLGTARHVLYRTVSLKQKRNCPGTRRLGRYAHGARQLVACDFNHVIFSVARRTTP